MDAQTALGILDDLRAEIEESGTVPPMARSVFTPLARWKEVSEARARGEKPPRAPKPARANCIHAEDTGELFNPAKACMGRKIICGNEACDMHGQAWPSSKCGPDRCKFYQSPSM